MKYDTKLKEVLTKDSKKGKEGLKDQEEWWKTQTKNNMELPLEFYKKFRLNDKILSYASLQPNRVEPRIAEIFRKFSYKLKEYKQELEVNFNLDGKKTDINEVKDRVQERKDRQERQEKMKAEVEKYVQKHIRPDTANQENEDGRGDAAKDAEQVEEVEASENDSDGEFKEEELAQLGDQSKPPMQQSSEEQSDNIVDISSNEDDSDDSEFEEESFERDLGDEAKPELEAMQEDQQNQDHD